MLFTDRETKNKFLTHCYKRGIRVASRRYTAMPRKENCYTPEDIVAGAILKINKYLRERNFESELHAECVFFLCLRSEASFLRSRFKKHLSLDQPLSRDNDATFQDFVAARIVYPTLDEADQGKDIKTIMKCLGKDEEKFVYQAWVQDLSVQEIAKIAKKPEKYVKRSLDSAKLKLSRKMFNFQL